MGPDDLVSDLLALADRKEVVALRRDLGSSMWDEVQLLRDAAEEIRRANDAEHALSSENDELRSKAERLDEVEDQIKATAADLGRWKEVLEIAAKKLR